MHKYNLETWYSWIYSCFKVLFFKPFFYYYSKIKFIEIIFYTSGKFFYSLARWRLAQSGNWVNKVNRCNHGGSWPKIKRCFNFHFSYSNTIFILEINCLTSLLKLNLTDFTWFRQTWCPWFFERSQIPSKFPLLNASTILPFVLLKFQSIVFVVTYFHCLSPKLETCNK